MISCRNGLLAATLLLTAGCALSAPPATETLLPAGAPGAASAIAGSTPDAEAQQTLAAALAEPTDPVVAVAAARALFAAADHRLQLAVVDWLTAHPDASLAAVLAADDQVATPVRKEIVSLCQQGLELAQRAVADGRAEASLQVALHLSLLAWANGAARSLFAGYGPRLNQAIAAAVAADERVDGAGPLRLQGRFRTKAPWPYADLELAEQSLQHACALQPNTIHWLFLGDLLWARDRREEARAAWQRAMAAGDDDSTRWVGDLLRRQAAARLRAGG